MAEEEWAEGLGNGLSFRASANNVSNFFSSSTFYDSMYFKANVRSLVLEDPEYNKHNCRSSED